jgi:hypothetical protein
MPRPKNAALGHGYLNNHSAADHVGHKVWKKRRWPLHYYEKRSVDSSCENRSAFDVCTLLLVRLLFSERKYQTRRTQVSRCISLSARQLKYCRCEDDIGRLRKPVESILFQHEQSLFLKPHISTLMMEAEYSFQTSVSAQRTTWFHNLEDHNIKN